MKTTRQLLFSLLLFCTGALMFASTAHAQTVPLRIEINSNGNVPTMTLRNTGRLRITRFEMTIGHPTYHFDGASSYMISSGATMVSPQQDEDSNVVVIEFDDFAPDDNISFRLDFDRDGQNSSENYRNILFNNGNQPNSVITVTDAEGNEDTFVWPNSTHTGGFTYHISPQRYTLSVSSLLEDNSTEVPWVNVLIGDVLHTAVADRDFTVDDGTQVEVRIPQAVYKDGAGDDITSSVANNAQSILTEAEERLTAIGITVNDTPQTGDPTLYRFEMTSETQLSVKWEQEFALRITHDFLNTESLEQDGSGNPWAGPLISDASGNPEPAAKKHWVRAGETVISQIDGSVLDFSRPGLDIRYVPVSANLNGSASDTTSGTSALSFGDLNAQRQQIPEFTMDSEALIEYVWQIQYGVKVNVDDANLNHLPKIFRRNLDSTLTEVGSLEGTFWFNPGANIVIACAANETTDPSSSALVGWLNGDNYYFSGTGTLDTETGEVLHGEITEVSGSPVAVWRESFSDSNSRTYRGLEILDLQRPARALWSYGGQVISVTVPIGKHIFQDLPAYSSQFKSEPELLVPIEVSGRNQNPDNGMSLWDENSRRLYPIVPGTFRATWYADPADDNPYEVLVTSVYPTEAHYPHIAGSPAVNLDPDPNDDVIFNQIVYSENLASADGTAEFLASSAGRTVLLFSELQSDGRGPPTEFLRVRVVETKEWDDPDVFQDDGTAIIGQKITDSALDLAELGTGHILFPIARYNPFIYDAEALDALNPLDVYDMDALRSTLGTKTLASKDALPGNIIPVNLNPGAPIEEQIVVAWYDDPAENDLLLWPYATRLYAPAWPTTTAQGLGRIVIASQHGSESLDSSGNDQVVVPAIGNAPEDVTYNPSRLQQVSIYQQPDRSSAGYNPNEEHALMEASLRYANVSPRPQAAYALRNNDLNIYNDASDTEENQTGDYTSHPFVLTQFFDTADNEDKMRVYQVVAEDTNVADHYFANQSKITPSSAGAAVSSSPRSLVAEPHVTMKAGEPVIPFYPLGPVSGAAPSPETFGTDIKSQITYWEDHKGSFWAVSGGENAWFTVQFFYPMAPDFWWPDGAGRIRGDVARGVNVGDSVAFLPANISHLLGKTDGETAGNSAKNGNKPKRVLYKSEWPDVAPILKAGETLTYQGGEYRADHPTSLISDDDGNLSTVETPGLPAVLAFATAEVVFDIINPEGFSDHMRTDWTARIAQVLEVRTSPLAVGDFPPELSPASGRTRVVTGKYIFNDLPASLQKRLRYDPTFGQLEFSGEVNDKDIADSTLTAAPPAVYVLEPNILTSNDLVTIQSLDNEAGSDWDDAAEALYELTRNPEQIEDSNGVIEGDFLVGLEREIKRDADTGEPELTPIEDGSTVMVIDRNDTIPAQFRGFGPGLALFPNAGFLDPDAPLPPISWVTVAENNDPSLGGSPVTLHVIKVDQSQRYRGSIKTILSDNVFDENMTLRHTADFGTHTSDLFFDWWYRPDDGSLNVPPPDLIPNGQTNPWKLFPDPTGQQGRGRNEILLKGNPQAPEALLADSFWFARYRHSHDRVDGTDWNVSQFNGDERVNFTWAGAGNSDPFNDFDFDGIPDFRAQLASGWIKRVLDAVNPYEARIRDFSEDNPSTRSSLLAQLGPRFEGSVALNPDKDVIENVGLIELYETILKRGSDLSINLSRPVSTPAIANALQLASTRISDFYMLLANEAYSDAQDPTIGHGSDSADYGTLAPAIHSFQNQMSSLIEEELALLRGVDDFFARPVYNRLFWNFTKGEGEAAYALNYNLSDVNADGFIDEDDGMIMYPQGHGDAWGHYLSAIRNQYDLLKHSYFNWVSRSEFYNLQDIVIKVDFLDERKFAQVAAAKAKAASEVVDLTYREAYVEDPLAQWQGYTDSNADRAWGVQGWSRRAAQGAYFDWLTANALLPSEHPNGNLEGIQKVDRQQNSDIAVISANLNRVQTTFDEANAGKNPLGVLADAVPFDINPDEVASTPHFEQIYERARLALVNLEVIWNNANRPANMLRKIGNSEEQFRNKTFQEDLTYKNRLIKIFGRPYQGTIGSGKLYPAGYDGPDLSLYMYANVREITNETVPGPAVGFASFNGDALNGGAFKAAWDGADGTALGDYPADLVTLYASSFDLDADGGAPANSRTGYFNVNYTDLSDPKVNLTGLTSLMPVTTAGYTFPAPDAWGERLAVGELQLLLNRMLQQEASIARAIGAWDALTGELIREFQFVNAQAEIGGSLRQRSEDHLLAGNIINTIVDGIKLGLEASELAKKATTAGSFEVTRLGTPLVLPTGGLAVSPGDALAPLRGGLFALESITEATFDWVGFALKGISFVQEKGFLWADYAKTLADNRDNSSLGKRDRLKTVENMIGDEPVLRVEVFKQIEALRNLSLQYVKLLDEGNRLVDERIAFNKRVAAQTQRNRYQDIAFRVSRNHALDQYRAMFDLAARYTYLAAKAYDYETNLPPGDPGSVDAILEDIVEARTLGYMHFRVPQVGGGGLANALATLKTNYDSLSSQMGFNNPQSETGKMSLRSEKFRIFPKGQTQPAGFTEPGTSSDALWKQTLADSVVDDLWEVSEFRNYCRPFAAAVDENGDPVPQPGIVLRFGSEIIAGNNFFGQPLGGSDHAYDPSNFATKLRSLGVWFSDYQSDDLENDLPEAPRIYLLPVGQDVMGIPTAGNPEHVRMWNVVDQKLPVPLPAENADLDSSDWIPLLDSMNGQFGETRKFSSFRAYHNGSEAVNTGELVYDSRLVGRSVWNTEWVMIIPGITLNSDPEEGLRRFMQQVSDIKLVFQTYGISGN